MGYTPFERVLQPTSHSQHERHGLLGRDSRAQLHEVAKVHSLDIFHDHEMSMVLLSDVDDLDDIGMAQPDAGLGLFVKPLDSLADRREPLAKDLDRQGRLGRDVLAAIDAGEGPLREVEEHLGVAIEKPAWVSLLEPIDLPARQDAPFVRASAAPCRAMRPRPRPSPREAARARPSRASHLIDHHFGIKIGHGKSILALASNENAKRNGPDSSKPSSLVSTLPVEEVLDCACDKPDRSAAECRAATLRGSNRAG